MINRHAVGITSTKADTPVQTIKPPIAVAPTIISTSQSRLVEASAC